jgi:hypothetical protein
VTVFFPDGVSSLGKDTWRFAVAIASKAAATVAELTAATGVDIQLAMRPGFGIESDTSKIDDRRHGSFVTYQGFGVTNRTFADIRLIDRPQDAAAAAFRKAIETLAEGTNGFMINRRGLGSASENWVAWATGQKYVLIPCQCGPQTPVAPADEGGQFELVQPIIVTGPLVYGTVA